MAVIAKQNTEVRALQGWHLYHHGMSQCSQRVRICLEEKRVPWTSHAINLLLSETIRLNPGFAYLDASFSSFPDAACTNAQAIAFTETGEERGACLQDLSGKSLQYSPEYAGNLSIEYFTDIGTNMELKSSVEMLYSDCFEIASDLDANVA